jgi:hypothetical protein
VSKPVIYWLSSKQVRRQNSDARDIKIAATMSPFALAFSLMSNLDSQLATVFVREMIHQLHEGLEKIRHCLRQLNEEQVWSRPTPAQNSIANLMLHLEGNVRQWIVSGVGGEPDVRDRPHEFAEAGPIGKGELLVRLSDTVGGSIQIISDQSADALLKVRRIQGFDTTVAGAIIDSVAHFRGHSQEIISLTRQLLENRYEFYFVPKTPEQGA